MRYSRFRRVAAAGAEIARFDPEPIGVAPGNLLAILELRRTLLEKGGHAFVSIAAREASAEEF